MDGKYNVVLDYEGENQAFENMVENDPNAKVLSGPIKASDGEEVGTFQILANGRVVILDKEGQVIHRTISEEDKYRPNGNWRLIRMAKFSESGEFINNNPIKLKCPSFLSITAVQVKKYGTVMTVRCMKDVGCDTVQFCYHEPLEYFAEAAGPGQLAIDNRIYHWSFHGDTLVLEAPLHKDPCFQSPRKYSWHKYYQPVNGAVSPPDSPCGFYTD